MAVLVAATILPCSAGPARAAGPGGGLPLGDSIHGRFEFTPAAGRGQNVARKQRRRVDDAPSVDPTPEAASGRVHGEQLAQIAQ